MDITKEDIINETFAGYADSKSAITGFVAWAWGACEDTLDLLHGGDFSCGMDQLADEVAHTVNQRGEHQGEDFEEAAREWLDYNRDELIAALENEPLDA